MNPQHRVAPRQRGSLSAFPSRRAKPNTANTALLIQAGRTPNETRMIASRTVCRVLRALIVVIGWTSIPQALLTTQSTTPPIEVVVGCRSSRLDLVGSSVRARRRWRAKKAIRHSLAPAQEHARPGYVESEVATRQLQVNNGNPFRRSWFGAGSESTDVDVVLLAAQPRASTLGYRRALRPLSMVTMSGVKRK